MTNIYVHTYCVYLVKCLKMAEFDPTEEESASLSQLNDTTILTLVDKMEFTEAKKNMNDLKSKLWRAKKNLLGSSATYGSQYA